MNKEDRGSETARAISKGIKEKEYSDFERGVFSFFATVGAIILGVIFHSFWVGLISFILFMIPITKRYYKE
jgi:hypothetical protein